MTGVRARKRAALATGLLLSAMLGAGCSSGSSNSATTPTSSAPVSTSATSPPPLPHVVPTVSGPPEQIAAGSDRSPQDFAPAMRFRVPAGWYGGGDQSGWSIGHGLNTAEQRYEDEALNVQSLDVSERAAIKIFTALHGMRLGQREAGRVAGQPCVIFHARPVSGEVSIEQFNADINKYSDRQFFLTVAGTTLLIRTEVFHPNARPALDQLLASLSLSS